MSNIRNSKFTGTARPTCYKCFRPITHCVCSLVPAFEAHSNILILQHPNERKKYYSTVKILLSSVKNTKLVRGIYFDQEHLETILAKQNVYLLFPSPQAQDCENVILDSNTTVIAIDGTWSEAKKIIIRNPILETFHHISFSKPILSNYRIRKQPKQNYLSTLESVAHLLKLNASKAKLLEQCNYYDTLLQGFDKMVDQQINYFPARSWSFV